MDTEENAEDNTHSEQQERSMFSALATPVAIILAGALISGAVLLSKGNTSGGGNAGVAAVANAPSTETSAKNITKVNSDEHIFGNPKADITLVEFSDFQCPFCARFHPTLERVVNESKGTIRWVYRHFPLTTIHQFAEGAAKASECVAENADNDAFWKFAKGLFENQDTLGTALFEKLAAPLGISKTKLTACMTQEDIAKSVNDDLKGALDSGGQGTPYVVIINKKGGVSSFSGALPYEQVVGAIKQATEK